MQLSLVLRAPVFGRIQQYMDSNVRERLYAIMISINFEQRLLLPTLLHTMQLIDQVLSKMSLEKGEIMLIAVASLMLVSKLEEIYVSLDYIVSLHVFIIIICLSLSTL